MARRLGDLAGQRAWHTSPIMKKRLEKMNLPIIYSGPYSYSAAPAESVFASLKLGELNPEHLPTGKKEVIFIQYLN